MNREEIWVLDESRFNTELVKALQQGKAHFHEGVAYMEGGGIIQHLPFKKFPLEKLESLEQAVRAAQATTLVATALSTSIIVGAIIVQTRYLAAKIEVVRKAVDAVASKIDEQNVVFCIDRLSTYLGHLETCQTLLANPDARDEISDLAVTFIPTFMGSRSHVLSLVKGLSNYLETQPVSTEHLETLLSFTMSCLDIVPKGIRLEHMLCSRIGKPLIGRQILIEGAQKHGDAIDGFRNHLNQMSKQIIAGHGGRGHGELIDRLKPAAMSLLGCGDNRLLLEPPPKRILVSVGGSKVLVQSASELLDTGT
jgi:hypothetical protein